MTKFIATPGPVFKESFLQHLVSIHFPEGKLFRVSFTGSGPGSGVAHQTATFAFGTFNEPILDLSLSTTGQHPTLEDPPTAQMIQNLYAWSTFSDQGNFVYFNTAKVAAKFGGKYSPVVLKSPGLNGVPPFASTHIFVWYFLATQNPPTSPLDPALTENNEGAVLATFDPTAPSNYSVGQILDFINAYADGTQSPGIGGFPNLPIQDGGDAAKGASLVGALAAGSHIIPSLGGPNTYVSTSISNNPVQLDAGWGMNAALYNIVGGVRATKPIATLADFKVGQNVGAVTITIGIDAAKGKLTETKS